MKISCGTSLLVTAVLTAGFTTTAMGQVNDECSGALTLPSGVAVSFDTTNATNSADPVPSDTQCAATFLGWGTTNKDVWFKFTPSEGGTVDLSTCATGSFDTSIVLYSGSCGSLTQIACNGDGTGLTGCQGFYSFINDFAVSAGTTYYLRLGGYNDATTGVDSGPGAVTMTFTAVAAGCPSANNCAQVNTTPGCSDTACCTNVCAANPLCCDIAWDQSCVDAAVQLCGIFAYSCQAPAPGIANDCAINATVFSGDSVFADVSNVGCNTDGPNHLGANCASGNDFFFNDRWWRVQAQANGSMRVNTCNATTYDSKVAVYNMGTNPATFDFNTLNTAIIGCNDDGPADCAVSGVFPSDLSVNVVQGNWYLVRLATYDNPGVATLRVDMPEPCALPAQTGVSSEACGAATNNGCNAGGATEDITLGSRIRGTIFTAVDPVTGGNTRDTDFYRLVVTQPSQVTMKIFSASFVTGLIMQGDIAAANCAGISILSTASGSCPATATACLNPGTYYVFVAPQVFTGIPCGSGAFNDYVVELTSAPANCPVIADQTCTNPGANTFASSTAAAGGGLVACAVNPAFPNCAQGGSTVNSFARPMPAGAVGGAITCIDFGVFAVRRGTNAGNTACANFASDLPLPAKIGVYRDIDGGAPRNKIVTAGDGNDLQFIGERDVLIPGGAYVANIDFDPPLCIAPASGQPAGNIVVIMDCPDLNGVGQTPTIPDNAGYGVRAGGGTVAGQASGTYIRLSCADAAGAYVLAESLGATFTAQWIVTFKGNFAGCASPCPTDIDGNGSTGASDLSALLNGWGTSSPDLNGDGVVGAADLSALLNGWGACP